jgi:ABC-type nickel/cobalt efflux system permease component RcnA
MKTETTLAMGAMLASMLTMVAMVAMLTMVAVLTVVAMLAVLTMVAPSTPPMTGKPLRACLGSWRVWRKLAPSSLWLTQLEHGVRMLRLRLARFTQVKASAH